MNKKLIFTGLLLVGLIGCADQSVQKYKDKAAAEQEGANEAENDNLAKKAAAMEADLSNRHYYYSAVEGEFVGTLTVDEENYKIRFTLARSVPPYTGQRIRQLSEIENDINNLFFHMQIVQWHPDDTSSAVGCRVSGIRPNMDDGQLIVASSDCPNLYTVLISEGGAQAFKNKNQKASDLANKLKGKELAQIENLIGYVQPSSVSAKYAFAVKRVE